MNDHSCLYVFILGTNFTNFSYVVIDRNLEDKKQSLELGNVGNLFFYFI